MNYTHITEEERYQIYELRHEGFKLEAIGMVLGRDKSTISRELRRNKGERGYRPKQAQTKAEERARHCANGRRVPNDAWVYVEEKLKLDWSPEQIAGRMAYEGLEAVSHETIYQHVYADKAEGGELYRHLRCQKQRRKRYGSGQSRRGKIPNRVCIEQRPAVVDAKSRVGDWEGDTIIGAGQSQAIVSVVERTFQFTVLAKVERKTSVAVSEAIISKLKPLKTFVHTLTMDNGTEFAAHEQIAMHLEADTYFAHPYCSWERGLNEQVNGLVRQYFPKSCRFDTITDADVQNVAYRLNNRPRKSLDYKTPTEALLEAARKNGVALRI
jgi:IS30 family transposase